MSYICITKDVSNCFYCGTTCTNQICHPSFHTGRHICYECTMSPNSLVPIFMSLCTIQLGREIYHTSDDGTKIISVHQNNECHKCGKCIPKDMVLSFVNCWNHTHYRLLESIGSSVDKVIENINTYYNGGYIKKTDDPMHWFSDISKSKDFGRLHHYIKTFTNIVRQEFY